MRFATIAASLVVGTLTIGVIAHDSEPRFASNKRHANWRRQTTATSSSSSPTPTMTSGASTTTNPSSSPTPAVTSGASTTTQSMSSATSTNMTASQPPSTSTIDANFIPPLSEITSGMPTQGTVTMFTSFAAGATPPVSGAPPLPSITIVPSNYPTLDKPPPLDSPEVQQWVQLLQGANIPDLPTTVDGTCASDPALVANASASGSCWWTCGGCLRATDISVCPDKNTWGVSYDDGPSPYTPHLINYLNQRDLKATFFIVGSRAVSRPDMLQTEYMLGHEISVHTWSHPHLTTLTNEQIVAELGWTKKIIKDVIGVTPNTFRPPYGDLDDRVRAIAKVMGLTPIQWTGSGSTQFDTDDWKIPAGDATGLSSYAAFQNILNNASVLSTGFIVLEHDLYQQTVDMAIGYFLPLAFNRSFTLKSINDCLGQPSSNCYIETYQNGTGNQTNHNTSTQGGQGGNAGTAVRVPTQALAALFISFLMMGVGAALLG